MGTSGTSQGCSTTAKPYSLQPLNASYTAVLQCCKLQDQVPTPSPQHVAVLFPMQQLGVMDEAALAEHTHRQGQCQHWGFPPLISMTTVHSRNLSFLPTNSFKCATRSNRTLPTFILPRSPAGRPDPAVTCEHTHASCLYTAFASRRMGANIQTYAHSEAVRTSKPSSPMPGSVSRSGLDPEGRPASQSPPNPGPLFMLQLPPLLLLKLRVWA